MILTKPKLVAVKLAENYKTVVMDALGDMPIVSNHQDRLEQMSKMGYRLVSVDNGIAYFELVLTAESYGGPR